MNDWYYATASGQRCGPLPAADLRALAAAGTIGPQTLAWRGGMSQWRPLHELATELELPALPPPLPAFATASHHAPSPPRDGMSGVLIAILVVGGGLGLLAVLGIMAAIALPAYNDYVQRAKVAEALVQPAAMKAAIAEFLEANGRCPQDDDAGFGELAAGVVPPLGEVTFGEFESSKLCGMQLRLALPGKPALDGKAIWLEYDPAKGWQCSSEIDDRHLPANCRG
jgi:type IV pilus assembly protein PilA